MRSVQLQGELEEIVDERTKLVISLLLNSGENQVTKSFELFDAQKFMYLQAEKVKMGFSWFFFLFSGKVLRRFLK